MDVVFTRNEHLKYAGQICRMISDAAKNKGSGLAKRSIEYIEEKIKEDKAVIALNGNEVVGFCYIESWGHEKFVANSGLIVKPECRGQNLARRIKTKAFELSLIKFPNAKIFGLTTSLAVMKINSDLGYRPVTFTELTDDVEFWRGCESCNNYDILQRTKGVHCLCTAMVYSRGLIDKKNTKWRKPFNVYQRWAKLKQNIFRK